MLRNVFGKCSCYGCCNDDDDSEQQKDKDQQIFKRFKGGVTRIPHSITESTLASALTTNSNFGVDPSSIQQSGTFIKRRTPVLFCTNRGLHLRVAKVTSPSFTDSLSSSNEPTAFYDISFCDLERWSTNRAYTVSLEDTFTIAHRSLETVEEHPTSSTKLHFPNRNLGFSQCCGSNLLNGFIPIKRSLYYDNAYSRFETGK